MTESDPKRPQPPKKRGPVPDTLTIPGNWSKSGRKSMKKAPQAPSKKIGRKRP